MHSAVRLTPSAVAHRLLGWLLPAGVVLLTVVLPRIAPLSSLPTTDEGYMAYIAMRMHDVLAASLRLPDEGPLMFYPALTSWAFGLDGNALVTLRVTDMVVAAVASLLFLRVMTRESRSLLLGCAIGGLFLWTMNDASFVQAGYKNSYFAAYIPLFSALLLAQAGLPRSGGRWRWLAVGALVAAGILLRETLAPFALVGALAVWAREGRRAALQFCVGGLAFGAFTLALMLALRGGVHGLVAAYQGAGMIYAAIADQRHQLFVDAVHTSVRISASALWLTGIGIIGAVAIRLVQRSHADLGRALFWLACALVALIEPVTKIGFPYHFSVCLPGLAGLCALSWRIIAERVGETRKSLLLCVGSVLIALLFLTPAYRLLAPLPQATRAAVDAQRHGWSDEATAQSNYLLSARLVREATPPGGTASISGFMFSIYPLSGTLPPSAQLNNLTGAAIHFRQDSGLLAQALRECSPDVIMTTTRTDWPASASIVRAVEATGLYKPVGEVPNDPARSYGNFGGTVYRRTGPGGSHCKP
ncbi:MAG: hypothetical protein J7507_00415 [Pseudoxanthomonas sp.]|nr:hypothetical protein [Pseudoxanthomonas sp.]